MSRIAQLTMYGATLFAAIGCAESVRGANAEAKSAEAHPREAGEHAREEREQQRRHDAAVGRRYDERSRYPQEFDGYDPAALHLHLAREHQKHAREHLEAARVLEDFEAARCGAFSPRVRVVCPLIGQVEAVKDISGGVRIRFAPGIDMNAVVAHMRCHIAFAAARGYRGMEACPLYLRGVRLEHLGRSRSVDLTLAGTGELENLRLRTHGHVSE